MPQLRKARRIKKKTPEGIVTKRSRFYLDQGDIFYWKQQQGLGSHRGISDIIGIRIVKVEDLVKADIKKVGIFFCLELKGPGNKPTPDQARFQEDVRRNYGLALCTDNPERVADWVGVKRLFR